MSSPTRRAKAPRPSIWSSRSPHLELLCLIVWNASAGLIGQCSPSKARSCPTDQDSSVPKRKRPHEAAESYAPGFFLSEVIVHAGPNDARVVSVCCARDGEAAVGEVDIEVFDLGAPVRSKAELGASPQGPARSDMGFRQSEGLGPQLAEGQSAGAVEQDIVERVAGAATDRAKPGIGELPGREGIVGTSHLNVTLDTEHPGPSSLPIVARLRPTDE